MANEIAKFMRWYVGEYLADTDHLNMEENGTYAHLLMKLWQRRGYLALDHEELARLCRMPTKRWEKVWQQIAGFFQIAERDGKQFISQRRLLYEFARAEERCDANRKNGSLGGRPSKTQPKPSGFPNQNPVGYQNETQTEPNAKQNLSDQLRDQGVNKISLKKDLRGEGDDLGAEIESPPLDMGYENPFTLHGLANLLTIAVKKKHPDVGMRGLGWHWQFKARDLIESFPPSERTEEAKQEMLEKIRLFAESDDDFVRGRSWDMEAFVKRFNELGRPRQATNGQGAASDAIRRQVAEMNRRQAERG